MATIGFIGLGNMGAPMAANLVKAGHAVRGFDLAAAHRAALTACGGIEAASAADAADGADTVITMLPAGHHVRAVLAEVFDAASPGALLIDSSTIDVATAKDMAAAAAARGLPLLDAPVSGGTTGAAAGTLTFMVGGTEEAFARGAPILRTMGRNIVHAGPAGSGQAAKVCNNLILGISMLAVSEAFALAERLGAVRAVAVRYQQHIVRPVLGADQLLPRCRPGSGLAGEPRLCAGLRGRSDAEGPHPRGRSRCRVRRRHGAGPGRARCLCPAGSGRVGTERLLRRRPSPAKQAESEVSAQNKLNEFSM